MGVGIGGDRSVDHGRFVDPKARADIAAVALEPEQNRRILVQGGAQHLIDRQEELRDHVPVDAAQSLVFEEGARPACEGLVIENRLVDLQDLGFILLCQGPEFGAPEARQGLLQIHAAPERGVEPDDAF